MLGPEGGTLQLPQVHLGTCGQGAPTDPWRATVPHLRSQGPQGSPPNAKPRGSPERRVDQGSSKSRQATQGLPGIGGCQRGSLNSRRRRRSWGCGTRVPKVCRAMGRHGGGRCEKGESPKLRGAETPWGAPAGTRHQYPGGGARVGGARSSGGARPGGAWGTLGGLRAPPARGRAHLGLLRFQ